MRSSFSITSRARAASESRSRPGLEAAERVALARADVQDDDGFRSAAQRIEQRGLDLEVARGARDHLLVLRVQNDVLPGVAREADVEFAREGADARELVRALLDLPVELRQVGVRRVRRQVRRHPVHPDLVATQVLQDRRQVLERVAQVRAGLPAPRIVARQPAFT